MPLSKNALANQSASTEENNGESGIHVMEKGSDSFKMRLTLIREAKQTLDLQYYSIHDDTTSNLLLEAMIQAAKQGVKIRFLLDQIDLNPVKHTIAMLQNHTNIEVRIFNPYVRRKHSLLTRLKKFFCDIGRMNRRMHNKSLIMDNTKAIVGGRNLGDEYFEEHTDFVLRDIDFLITGAVIDDIKQSFDTYWNDKNAYPLQEVIPTHTRFKAMRKIRRQLLDHWHSVFRTRKGKQLLKPDDVGNAKNSKNLIWAKTELWADPPHKINTTRTNAQSPLLDRLHALTQEASQELLIISPYFVPLDTGVEWIKHMIGRGLKIKVLTNSLASTDVVAVHTGYRRYRMPLLEMGVEIHEMKPQGKRPRQRLLGRKAPANARLHAKAYVIDKSICMTGSFNLDPRSIELNTELALVIHSEPISRNILDMYAEMIKPENSYELKLEYANNKPQLTWHTQKNKRLTTFYRDPEAGLRNLQVEIMDLFPIERQL